MTATLQPQDADIGATLSDVVATLSDVVERLDTLTADVEKLSSDLNQTKEWQDRTWDVIKWAIGLSTGLSITATATLFGLAIRSLLIGS